MPKRFDSSFHLLERAAVRVRRTPLLRRASPLWNAVRPAYIQLLSTFGRQGLQRTINGSDRIRVLPELYTLPETYEPDVWQSLMRELRPGDVVADIGAHLGLYTVAISKRIGPHGRVYAFEPDPNTIGWLRRQVELNGLQSHVEVFACAVGEHDGTTPFIAGHGSESHVGTLTGVDTPQVPVVRLDTVFKDTRVDVLKLDVEGFEEHVLRGATELLRDPHRAPRLMFVEVHPYAWTSFGVSSDSLLQLFQKYGYEVSDLAGNRLACITDYGEIVARGPAQTSERPA